MEIPIDVSMLYYQPKSTVLYHGKTVDIISLLVSSTLRAMIIYYYHESFYEHDYA